MPLHKNTFETFPNKSVILDTVEKMRNQKYSLDSYIWYLMPLEDKFGSRVYETAAKSLNSRGVNTSSDELKALADDMRAEKNSEKYLKQKRLHQQLMLTTIKQKI